MDVQYICTYSCTYMQMYIYIRNNVRMYASMWLHTKQVITVYILSWYILYENNYNLIILRDCYMRG